MLKGASSVTLPGEDNPWIEWRKCGGLEAWMLWRRAGCGTAAPAAARPQDPHGQEAHAETSEERKDREGLNKNRQPAG